MYQETTNFTLDTRVPQYSLLAPPLTQCGDASKDRAGNSREEELFKKEELNGMDISPE